jgi:hypothetical protein
MLAFWPDVVRPMLEALEPRGIVEIGSEAGKTTRLLAQLARERGAVLHAVDPAPLFDPDAWRAELGPCFVFHRLPSLAALERIGGFDAVLVDGDHNWYTVLHELRAIERRSAELGQPLPLVVLHDVGWPYGRRDLYYDPEAIPAEHRHPWARRGISPTASELVPEGGYNAHLCNAVHEGGACNGVLTAVEDYLAATSERFVVARIPAVFGLAILMPEALGAARPALARLVAAWTAPEVERFVERLEMARIAMLTRLGG